ncbi:MAG: hypothetical protein CL489_06950 [Acidobacteria bacterium]|nr:hypothetical protein [Acidobacteriota bacterium]
MKRKPEYRPQIKVGGGWQSVRHDGVPCVCSSLGSAIDTLARHHPFTFNRAKDAVQPHEALARVVDEYGAVMWPRVLKGRT